jgi:hypothetical protein
MSAVNEYINSQSGIERKTLEILHNFLSELPGVDARINYGIPFYYRKSWLCYLSRLKKGGVELAFTRANELSNDQGLLEFGKRKQVAGIVIHSPDEIPWKGISEVIQEALLLDETVKYTIRKMKDNSKKM